MQLKNKAFLNVMLREQLFIINKAIIIKELKIQTTAAEFKLYYYLLTDMHFRGNFTKPHFWHNNLKNNKLLQYMCLLIYFSLE